MKTYSEKLKDPRWQKKRLEILGRDNFTCQECGCDDKTLHVHHLSYAKGKEPWDADDSNLRTLCENCHERKHDLLHDCKLEFSSLLAILNNEQIERLLHEIYGLRKVPECEPERNFLFNGVTIMTLFDLEYESETKWFLAAGEDLKLKEFYRRVTKNEN
jgi:hypothetical protein